MSEEYRGLDGAELQEALKATVGPGHGYLSQAEVTQFLGTRRAADAAAQAVRIAEVIRPGSGPDAMEREGIERQRWMLTTGRVLDGAELRGAPADGCDACTRLTGVPCEAHTRKLGDPIPLPPHPWPSEQPGHYPGAIRLPPYNIYNSVQ